jgi:cytochrome P450
MSFVSPGGLDSANRREYESERRASQGARPWRAAPCGNPSPFSPESPMIVEPGASQRWRPPAPVPPPGPLGPVRLLYTLGTNPVAAWTQAHFEEFFVQGRSVLGDMSVVSDPAAIRRVFVENAANYRKDDLQLRVLAPGLGNGLLTSDGDAWRAQRRAIAPLFTPRRIAEFLPAMRDSGDWLVRRWSGLRDRRRIDLSVEMSRVTLDVLERTIFPGGLAGDPEAIGRAMTNYFNNIGRLDPFDLLGLPDWVPRLRRRRRTNGVGPFGESVERMIEARENAAAAGPRAPSDRPDLLTLLMEASDPETGKGLSRDDVRANVATFIGAGHETTANALTWTLYLLARHPEWRARAEAEVDGLGPDGAVDETSLRQLVVVRAAFEEALRLYPPAASLSRAAIGADDLCGRRIRAGSTVVVSPWVVHRHRRLWRDPDFFDPSRFLPGARENIDRFAYLPFGAGPRVCIGQTFAMQEALVVLAAILRNFRLDRAPGPEPAPLQRVTLRPGGGMPMLIARRANAA